MRLSAPFAALGCADLADPNERPIAMDAALDDGDIGDGDGEIVASAKLGDRRGFLSWFRDDGEGALWTTVPLGLEHTAAIDSSDVDDDGLADIVACAGMVGAVFRNHDLGLLTPVAVDRTIAIKCSGTTVLDYNGEGGFAFADGEDDLRIWED